MRVKVSSTLDASANRVWELLQKPSTLQFVAAGMVHYQSEDTFPSRWCVGEQVNLKPKLFNWFDQGDYFVTFTDIDDLDLTMATSEKSATISHWRHTMRVTEVSGSQCVYTDEIYIEAGSQTRLVGVFAHVFYRHRHRRWRVLLASS
jgi:hypothetical protein